MHTHISMLAEMYVHTYMNIRPHVRTDPLGLVCNFPSAVHAPGARHHVPTRCQTPGHLVPTTRYLAPCTRYLEHRTWCQALGPKWNAACALITSAQSQVPGTKRQFLQQSQLWELPRTPAAAAVGKFPVLQMLLMWSHLQLLDLLSALGALNWWADVRDKGQYLCPPETRSHIAYRGLELLWEN